MADLFLGLDLGSTSVKAAVLDRNGTCLSRYGEGYATIRSPGGRAVQDPADWMKRIHRALAQFAGDGLSHRIAWGCLSSQVNTHVFVDQAGNPLMPAILWQDNRAIEEANELDARLTIEQKVAWLGAPIPVDASHPLARMLWVKRHEPEIWEKTAHVLLPKDYCLLQLTGVLATDPISNFPVVSPQMTYVPQMMDLVPGAAERFAPLAGLTDSVGQLKPALGLGSVRMIAGTMDGWMGLYGGGASRDGETVYMSGTSEILGVSSLRVNGTPGVVVFPTVRDLKIHAGPTQSGGASVTWFADIIGKPVGELFDLVAATARRTPTPLFLPQLAGERAPVWDASLRGGFLGLDAGMSTADLARGVVEGVAMSGRHILDALEQNSGIRQDTLRGGGGGFRSEIGGQIRANVLGRSLKRLAVNDPVVVGAAALAAYGAGDYDSLSAAHDAFARYDREWEPDPALRGLHDDLYGIYLDAMTAGAGLGRRLTQLSPRP